VLERRPAPSVNSTSASNTQEEGLHLAMVLLASVLASLVSEAGLGSEPAFKVPALAEVAGADIPLCWLLGMGCGATSLAFDYTDRGAQQFFQKLEGGEGPTKKPWLPPAVLPVLGGAATSVFALARPEIAYQGFENFNNILDGVSASGVAYTPSMLLEISALKIVATAVCRNSGLVGGIYAPSLFLGAAVGSGYGLLAQTAAAPLGLDLAPPQLYALVGAAATLAGVCRVPLTSVLLAFELTRDYAVLLPTLGAAALSFWVTAVGEANLPGGLRVVPPEPALDERARQALDEARAGLVRAVDAIRDADPGQRSEVAEEAVASAEAQLRALAANLTESEAQRADALAAKLEEAEK